MVTGSTEMTDTAKLSVESNALAVSALLRLCFKRSAAAADDDES